MRRRHQGFFVQILCLSLLSAITVSCLGQDYLEVGLELNEWDHGWLAVVEPDEEFGVALRENPQYPGATWTLAELDPAVIEPTDPVFETKTSEMPGALGAWVFGFAGTALGESVLTFEMLVDGQRVDVSEYTVAVVDDACAAETGITAARCRQDRHDDGFRGWTEWDHGTLITTALGEEIVLTLTANALSPDAPWQIVAGDSPSLEFERSRQLDSRTPGDWDISDSDKSGSFLPIWEFAFTAQDLGESQLIFEIRVDDEIIEVCEFTVVVEE